MPRASAADAAATALRVRESATALFAEHGFAAVSIDDVAREAGVTRGAVYHHYGSKPGLFRSVAARLQAGVAAAVVEAADGAAPEPAARLRAGCHAFLDAIISAPAGRVLLVDAPAVIGWTQWRALDAEHSVVHLREAVAATGAPADLVDALTAQLSGAMNEAALWLAEHPDRADSHSSAHRALDRLLDAITT